MTMELMMTVFIAIGMILVLLVYPIFSMTMGLTMELMMMIQGDPRGMRMILW